MRSQPCTCNKVARIAKNTIWLSFQMRFMIVCLRFTMCALLPTGLQERTILLVVFQKHTPWRLAYRLRGGPASFYWWFGARSSVLCHVRANNIPICRPRSVKSWRTIRTGHDKRVWSPPAFDRFRVECAWTEHFWAERRLLCLPLCTNTGMVTKSLPKNF